MMNDIDALNNLLVDTTILEKLEDNFNKKPNIFSILKVENREIRHSNLLAWLLNPQENHNLGSTFLKKFIETYLRINNISTKNISCWNLDNIKVLREWNNIDLLLLDDNNKVAILIENKIHTKEHDNQLERYYNTANEAFRDYDICYIYLTLDGSEAPYLRDVWLSMSYESILNILEDIINNYQLNNDVIFILDNYKETVRSLIDMENPEIKELCIKIYEKHKKAIDLIIENIPEGDNQFLSDLSDWIKNEWSKKLVFKNVNNHKWFEFTTIKMNEILPNINGKNAYKYFISIEGNCCKIALELQYDGLVNTPTFDLVKVSDEKINNHNLDNHKWARYAFKTWRTDISYDEEPYANFKDKLKLELENILFKEIPELENKIKESII